MVDTNSAYRGGGRGGGGGRGDYRGGGRGNNRGRGRGGFNNNRPKVKCQLCRKEGHSIMDCWHRYDEDFMVLEEKSANAAGNNYGVDTNWYTDTGSTDHITGALDKMVIHDQYTRGDQIHAVNGAGMKIEHIVFANPLNEITST